MYVNEAEVVCVLAACPEPDAAHRILSDPEVLHVVRIHPDESFTIKHPLIERLDDRLMGCRVFSVLQYVLHWSPTQPDPGDYRVAPVKDGIVQWEYPQ